MDEEKKDRKAEDVKKKPGLSGLFYHNTFVLIFSFCAALIAWFVMASGNTENNRTVMDVPLTITLSPAAEEDGIKVFSQSYNTADLEISGNSLITNKLTAENFSVTATLNPTSTKLTGNTLQKMSIPVRAVKNTAHSDYNIVSINPEEITVEYDRYKEKVFPIEMDLKYSTDSSYYSEAPVLSAESVTVSGPESSVNKISRVSISYSLGDALRSDASFTCSLRVYDQNNQEIGNPAGLYLEMDVDTVEVSIPVLSKKTVGIVASTVHQPKGFADSRITVEPAQIDIAGSAEALSAINEITLDTPIDFAELDLTQKNTFTADIPLPAGVRNVSAAGENPVSQATVTINLNGYQKATVTVPSDNFQVSNKPAGKDVTYNVQLLDVTVAGSEAQISKLTGDSLSVQLDLANFADQTGNVEVPATLAITGSGSDSCWILGKYTVSVLISDRSPAANTAGSPSSDGVAAMPQE